MRIGLKLTAAFLVIASLVGAAGYIAQRTGWQLQQQLERLSHRAIRLMAVTTEVTVGLYADHLAAHQQILARRRPETGASPPTGGRTRRGQRSGALQTTEEGVAELAELVLSGTSPSLERLQERFARHQELMDQLGGLIDADIDAAEQFLEGPIRRHFENELLPGLVAIRQQAEQESTGGIRSAERALVVADQRRGMLLVATAAISVSIGLFMSRSIGKPLRTLQQAAKDIGRGCLETRVAIRSRDEIGTLAASLNQMVVELQEKTVSKNYVDNIIRSMQEMLFVADSHQRIRLVNPATCSELGYTAADLVDRPLQELFAPDDPCPEEARRSADAHGNECSMQTASGRCIPVHFSAAEMRDEAGGLAGTVCVALNVSRQKETEHRLRASLREKELLLKEVHHRVKNNLQVISSLLSLQAQEIRDPEMIGLFEESQSRVRSMALIHEQLYRSDDLAHIDFAAYIRELVDNLKQGFGSAAARVDFCLDTQAAPLLLDLAIPCGMIVNELVANALKHAFPGDRRGEIRIAFRREDQACRITVADNGTGMSQRQAIGEGSSIGLKVVQALTRQIHGKLDHTCDEGSVFTIRFADPKNLEEP